MSELTTLCESCSAGSPALEEQCVGIVSGSCDECGKRGDGSTLRKFRRHGESDPPSCTCLRQPGALCPKCHAGIGR